MDGFDTLLFRYNGKGIYRALCEQDSGHAAQPGSVRKRPLEQMILEMS